MLFSISGNALWILTSLRRNNLQQYGINCWWRLIRGKLNICHCLLIISRGHTIIKWFHLKGLWLLNSFGVIHNVCSFKWQIYRKWPRSSNSISKKTNEMSPQFNIFIETQKWFWETFKGQLALFSSILLLRCFPILYPLELCGVIWEVLEKLNGIGLTRTAPGPSH